MKTSICCCLSGFFVGVLLSIIGLNPTTLIWWIIDIPVVMVLVLLITLLDLDK